MESSILNSCPFDPGYLVIGSIIISLVLLIIVIVCLMNTNRLYRRYDIFMRGRDAESLENHIMEMIDDIKDLKSKDRANKDAIRTMARNVRNSYQKFGMVKYNAFKGMGGNLSFSFAMLDYNNSGFIINAIHSREGCYLYMKSVMKGETEIALGSEEREALEQALGY